MNGLEFLKKGEAAPDVKNNIRRQIVSNRITKKDN